MDLRNNVWSVNTLLIALPVDSGESLRPRGLLVIVVEDGGQLRLHFSRFAGMGGVTQSIQPFRGQLIVCKKKKEGNVRKQRCHGSRLLSDDDDASGCRHSPDSIPDSFHRIVQEGRCMNE